MRGLGSGRSDPPRTAVFGAFFLTGVVTVLLGPILPELRASWRVDQAQLAPLFLAQFTASSIGAVLSGFWLRRSLASGYLLVGAGLALLAAGGSALSLAAMALIGLGLGLTIAASNLFIAHRDPTRRGGSLATLNVLWGLGAMISPLLVAGAREFWSLEATLGGLAVAAGLCGIGLGWLVEEDRGVAERASSPVEEPGADAGKPLLAVIAVILFLYVGAENTVGGWLVTLSDQLGGDRSTASLIIGSGFWAAILGGRVATTWILRLVSESFLYRLCLVLAGAGMVLLVLSSSRAVLAVAVVLVGLGMAPIFPLTVSLLARATASSRSRTAGWVLACGGLGGAALPWLTGRIGAAASLQLGFLVPLVALVSLAALYSARHSARLAGSD